MKLVYCLACDSPGPVVGMTRLSIATVRHTNPGATVELVVDASSRAVLAARRSRLLEEVDAVHVGATLPQDARMRSRQLKCVARSVVRGPFILIDADTIVRTPLRPAWPEGADVAASPNYSRDALAEQLRGRDAAQMAAMGWPRPTQYLNSGVVYFADSPRAHEVGRAWHDCWLQSTRRTGRHHDQPAFNHAVRSSNAALFVLPHGWNAQLTQRPTVALGAAIWHFYSSRAAPDDTQFSLELRTLPEHEPIPPSIVERLIRPDVPWPADSWIKRTVIARMLRRGRMTGIDSLLLAGWNRDTAFHAMRIGAERLRWLGEAAVEAGKRRMDRALA